MNKVKRVRPRVIAPTLKVAWLVDLMEVVEKKSATGSQELGVAFLREEQVALVQEQCLVFQASVACVAVPI